MLLTEFFDVAAYWVMCIADESVRQQVPMPFWSATRMTLCQEMVLHPRVWVYSN